MPTPPKRRTKARESFAARLLRGLPPLPDAHRDAFRSLLSDEACEALGARTKSAAVLREAEAWAKAIDRALRAHPYALRRYAPLRFAWLLECLRDLEDAVAAQKSPERGSARAAQRAEQQARAVLVDLATALEVVAAGRDEERRVRELVDGAQDRTSLASALRALADLADELGRAYDVRTRALVASVALHAGDALAARAAAAALEADDGSTREAGQDLSSTDRVEGRLLGEMRFALRVWERVRALHPEVPALVPGAATRALLRGA